MRINVTTKNGDRIEDAEVITRSGNGPDDGVTYLIEHRFGVNCFNTQLWVGALFGDEVEVIER
jgi:hypothetical protein